MTEPIHYREAIPTDVLKLSVLYQQVYIATYGREGVSDEFANFITKQFAPERIAGIISSRPGDIWVASYNDNLVGVAELTEAKPCPANGPLAPELSKLYILEWFCGRGIGEGLLQKAEQTLRSRGAKQLWLWLLHSNERALRFYTKQGYKDIGRAFFQMEQNRYENIVMVKQL